MVDTSQYLSSGCFKGKNVILTGATGGIGSLVLKSLLACGANVMAIIRNKSKLEGYLNDYAKTGQFKHEIIDLEVSGIICNSFAAVMRALQGKLDILIMCHGKFAFGGISTTTVDLFDEVMNINVRSNFDLLSLATPFLKLTKGNVVMISSSTARIVEKDEMMQAITKSMIDSMVRCAALELASFGVRINAVAPGITKTDLRVSKNNDGKVEVTEKDNVEYISQMKSFYLLNKDVIDPSDVADTILYLASDEAEFMTGEIVVVDSGFEMNHDLTFMQTND